jgi:hypothetical protein
LGVLGGRAAALLLTCVARHTALGAPCIASRPAPPKREPIPGQILTALSRTQPLCIDELGDLNLKSEQVNAFFRLMDQRYGRVSTIITTNLDYPAWCALFDNKPLVDALLDRSIVCSTTASPSASTDRPCAQAPPAMRQRHPSPHRDPNAVERPRPRLKG